MASSILPSVMWQCPSNQSSCPMYQSLGLECTFLVCLSFGLETKVLLFDLSRLFKVLREPLKKSVPHQLRGIWNEPHFK
jgi:hypothetical protein